MVKIANSLRESDDCGPIFGTPNQGRAERIDRADREHLRRCREAEAQVEVQQRRHERNYDSAEVSALRATNRWLRDQLTELRHQLATLCEELAQRTSTQIASELPGALHTMFARREPSSNGAQNGRADSP
jgi:hypothetical protein